MIILREEALRLASFIKMDRLSFREREVLVEDALCEIEEIAENEGMKTKFARAYLEERFSWYTNTYIKNFLAGYMKNVIDIEGEEPALFACPCCGYKTIRDFDICSVCFWEVDGVRGEDIMSAANHMTLREAKDNFLIYGAIDEKSLRQLDKERFLQFNK